MPLMSPQKATLNQLSVLVRDMKASVEFYRRLGLDIPDSGSIWDDHHRPAGSIDALDLEFDSTRFAEKWAGRGGAGFVLGFNVTTRDAVDELYDDMIAAGHKGHRPPHDAFWGARYAIMEDPDGNLVGLMSPIDDAHRSRAPKP